MSTRKLLTEFRDNQRSAFIPYVTAGDPNFAATRCFVEDLVEMGADIIELGVPFSDPVADGPVNQRASERALAAGASLRGVLDLVADIRGGGITTPLVLFTYLNPVLRMGYHAFATRAGEAGVNGVLVVDLPPEEADGYRTALDQHAIETIFLATPTSPPERLQRIDAISTGFVYYVSRTGVTGAQTAMSLSLVPELRTVREHVRGPLAVGFGISTPEHANDVAQLADAVVVGSAIVQIVERNPDLKAARVALKQFSKTIAEAVHRKR